MECKQHLQIDLGESDSHQKSFLGSGVPVVRGSLLHTMLQ